MSDSHAADVQAELQSYLNSKNINSLFIAIVESLLIEKPSNPIGFIMEYLHKQYPEQTKGAIENIAGPRLTSNNTTNQMDAKAESKTSTDMIRQTSTNKKTQSKIDDTDEEDDDVSDLQVKPVTANSSNKERRRISVSAESVDPVKMKAQRATITNVEKTPDVAARLREVVSKSPLLRTLDDEQRDMIVNAFTGPEIRQPGDTVIKQGDIGDVFYLLEDGHVDVYISKGGEEVKVHTYKPGDGFGELAIMYNAPRAATCRVATESKLWALDRNAFRVIVVAAAMIKREVYQGFLQKVPILQTLTEMEIMTLADSLAEEKYKDGDVICAQGEEGDFFYIIKDGTAVCSQVDSEGNQRVVATLTSGNYFGEIALLTTKPRQATVKASNALSVLSVDRAAFTRVFGNLDELMKRNMDEYNKYAAASI